MKKTRYMIYMMITFFSCTAVAQIKKPIIMVVPADSWCTEHGYTKTFDGKKVSDYDVAMTTNTDLPLVITAIGELMAQEDYPLKDLATSLKGGKGNTNNNTMSPLEALLARAKADILVNVAWKVNTSGPKKSVTYTLQAIDAYTMKQVASATGTGKPSFSVEVPVLIEEAVLMNMNNFIATLQKHFDDMQKNGREVTVGVKVKSAAGHSLEDMYEEGTLTDIIDKWMDENSYNHRYSLTDAQPNEMTFEQVRIPLYSESGSAMDTRKFVNGLTRFMNEKYGIAATISLKGLGRADLMLDFSKAPAKTVAKESHGHVPSLGNSDVDRDIPSVKTSAENTFAVIIGNENYQRVTKVPYAETDAYTFAQYCKNTLGMPDKNVRMYTNATYGTMLSAVSDVEKIVKAFNGNVNIIFYYAGHGIPDEASKESFLLPVDADGTQTEVCYATSKLYKQLGGSGAKNVVCFLDACFSGANRGDGMIVEARGVAIKPKAAAPSGNMVVFSAATDKQTAFPYKEKGHGMFTYFLLKKLKETKGNVTLGDLSDYIHSNVSQKSIVINGKEQTPVTNASTTVSVNWKTKILAK